jgi:hypothetical protein
LAGFSFDDLFDFCAWEKNEYPKFDNPDEANWDIEWNRRCIRAWKVLKETGEETEAIIAASDNNKLLSGDRAKAILAAARVLNGQQNIKDHPDFQIWAGDIANWKKQKANP